MNTAHRWICGSARWQGHVREHLLPWVLEGIDARGAVMEIGPGYGAATGMLMKAVAHLTCVEIDARLASALATRLAGGNATVVSADATRMPVRTGCFDAAICLTMLHHVPAPSLQDRLFREVARVLRVGGTFAGCDSLDGAVMRALHVRDTFVPVDPAALPSRLRDAGFRRATVEVRRRTFRFQAVR